MTETAAPIERTVPGLTPQLRRRLRSSFALLSAISPKLASRLALQLLTRPLPRPMSPEEQRFLSTARSRLLTTPAGEVRVYEWPGAGASVLLVHGWRSHSARLRSLIEALNAQGLRAVAFDAPGNGRSRGRRLDLPILHHAMSLVSRQYGPFAAVLGHSFGALASLGWLAQAPEAASVRAAVLIGVPRDAGYLFDGFAEAMALSPAVVAQARARFRRRYGSDPEQYNALDPARALGLPVLLLHGEADELVPPSHSQAVAAALAQARLLVLPELGHGGPLRDPHAVRTVVEFIAAQSTL